MYRINEITITADSTQLKTYGITYKDIIIEDISTNKRKIEELIALCNKLCLSPLHFYDVVEDFLVDNNL